MAIIHDTTMSPSKLELLTSWLPVQPWNVDTGRERELAKADIETVNRAGKDSSAR
jgi:hypothetical protein